MTPEKPQLRDSEVEPTDDVLKQVLGENVFPVFSELRQTVEHDFDFELLWHYYKDGGAWLCKVVHKKKTIFWLSVWDKHFKVSFYFTEKTRPGVTELNINDDLKKSMFSSKMSGKLIPLTFQMNNAEQLSDLLEVTKYKKGLK
ncbi:DUF3788 family protein [Saccharicrinis sp. FJH54]|uniref:DUF3788 family protein n=1 Tax=Saccharicrinis sp. FJH54 TaxID=3344665 RepID=UPI0035D4B4AB